MGGISLIVFGCGGKEVLMDRENTYRRTSFCAHHFPLSPILPQPSHGSNSFNKVGQVGKDESPCITLTIVHVFTIGLPCSNHSTLRFSCPPATNYCVEILEHWFKKKKGGGFVPPTLVYMFPRDTAGRNNCTCWWSAVLQCVDIVSTYSSTLFPDHLTSFSLKCVVLEEAGVYKKFLSCRLVGENNFRLLWI